MISFELRTTSHDSAGHARWVGVARVTVRDDGTHVIDDPDGLIDVALGHYSPRLGTTVRFDEDPEEWARAAMATYNAPDLAPAVIADTRPWDVPEVDDLTPRLAQTSRIRQEVPLRIGDAARLAG